jgi:ribosomal protein S27AE
VQNNVPTRNLYHPSSTYAMANCYYPFDESTTILTQNIQVCRRCGVVFDLNIRKNKDCPICGAGEHTELRMNNI